MAQEIGPAMRRLLGPPAVELGLSSYEQELLSPSGGEASRALHMLMCGARLLADLREPEMFPALDKRGSRRGGKYIDRRFAGPDGLPAATYLTRALAMLMEETMNRADEPEQAEFHRQAAEVFANYFPLAATLEEELAELRVEFTRLDTREPAPMPLNGWHMALTDSDLWDVDDPELIEIQLNFAKRQLILAADLTAVRLTLNAKQFAKVEEDLITPYDQSYDGLVWDTISLRTWTETAGDWRDALVL